MSEHEQAEPAPDDQRDWGDPEEHGHMADYATGPEGEPETVPYEPPEPS